jgi:hypothetical protein
MSRDNVTPPRAPAASCPYCDQPVEPAAPACPSCGEELRPPRRGIGALGAWAVALAALLTLAFVDTLWLLAVPAVGQKALPLTVVVLGLTDLGLAGAFFVFYKSLRKRG